MLPDEPQIVIAGAGFAGIRAALDIAKALPNTQITLIDNNPTHCFHADLYEVGTAILDRELKKDYRRLEGAVSIPLKQIFKGKNVKIVIDVIREIDLTKKEIQVMNNGIINFDFLVLSLGSTTNYFGIEGAQNYSHSFKNTEDALNVRDDIEELVYHADRQVKIVVAGGGFTGVELSGELSGYLKKLAKLYNKPVAQVSIIEASPTLLPGMAKWAQEKALKRLISLGIKIFFNRPISKVSSHEIFSEMVEAMTYDYLIWTTGVRGESLNGNIKGVEVTKRGKICTETDLSLKNFPNVFVVGDLAECIDPVRNCPLEATAWMGIAAGSWVAQNLVLRLHSKPTKQFISPKPVFVVPIGKKYALADLGFIKLSGFSAWVVKRLITLKYLLSILGPIESLTTWSSGVRIYGNND